MKKTKFLKTLFIILGFIIPTIVVILLAVNDVGVVFDSWGKQDDGSFVSPGWQYLLLIVFKLNIYILPPFIGSIGFAIENKSRYKTSRKFWYYGIKALNVHFLALLTLKLAAEGFFEVDRIFNIQIFGSIKEIQTLIGYILTFILSRNIKLEPGVETKIPKQK